MASILLFDSGIGGLTIYKHIAKQFPDAAIHYLADNARFPYGELIEHDLTCGCVTLIDKFVQQQAVGLVVVACNSASTIALDSLRAALTVPVVGVVPAIKPAAQTTQNNVIGLLATPGTVQRRYTDELITTFAADKEVIRIGSSRLVQLAEDKLSGLEVPLQSLQQILQPFIKADAVPDTVILGCTHFPLLAEELHNVLGDRVALIDSGAAVARRVEHQLEQHQINLHNNDNNGFFYTGSAPNRTLLQVVTKLGFQQCRLFSG
ncbi:glutamate racemase [Ferrimonas lipolytica]|uniref:Glutamate racemase n=1 Tax=Ferrimonas lipolytica TaxID=2724191 RepID=A0A6H1UHX4_9GAMM|nr:glutamate racemase [Ferrimonas lipolytica]QIZ78428.1 glutamate racemase [Ferrimonas lipolytica]